MSETSAPYLVSNEVTIHRAPIRPVKLLACGQFWWITQCFYKADNSIIYQSDSTAGPWEPCELTNGQSREPGDQDE